MNFVDFLTGNLILNLAILAWAIAQILKFIVVLISEGRMNWRSMLSSGGMPSSHSSFVCACASSVAYLYGWSSPLFAIAAVVAGGGDVRRLQCPPGGRGAGQNFELYGALDGDETRHVRPGTQGAAGTHSPAGPHGRFAGDRNRLGRGLVFTR